MLADTPSTPPLNGRTGNAGTQIHLRAYVEELYDTALEGLAHPDRDRGHQAIAHLSGHLAAMRRAVLPVASRNSGAGTGLAAACRAEGREAERALRGYECLLSGQSRAVKAPPGSAWGRLEQRLGHYRTAEHAILTGLDRWLSPGEHHRLTAHYRTVLANAPTRPHPRCPHTGPFAGLAFRLCVYRDRVLDTMDSRPAQPAP